MSVGLQHPYQRFEGSETWKILEVAMGALIQNHDVQLQTNRAYVIGYLCEAIASAKNTNDAGAVSA